MDDPDEEFENWRCPILSSIFVDPVVASDGHTYERAAIQQWFKISEETGTCLSPMTGFPLESKIVLKNHALRNTIENELKRRPEIKELQTKPEDVTALTGVKFEGFFGEPKTGNLIDFDTDADKIPQKQESENQTEIENANEKDGASSAEAKAVVYLQGQSSFLTISGEGGVKHWTENFKNLLGENRHHSEPPFYISFREDENGKNGASVMSSDVSVEMSEKRNSDPLWKCKDVKPISNFRLKDEISVDFSCTTCVASTPEGYVVTGERDGALRVWEWNSAGNLSLVNTKGTLNGHLDGGVCSIAAWPSPYGSNTTILASGARDKTVRIWESAGRVYDDSPRLNAGSTKQWDWKCQGILRGHKDFVTSVDIELGTGALISGSADWNVKLWDMVTKQEVETYEGHSYGVRCLSWATSGDAQLNNPSAVNTQSGSPCGVFCSGGEDEMVYVWDTRMKYTNKIARLNTGVMVLCCCWGPTDGSGSLLPWMACGGGSPSDSFNASSENVRGWLRVYDPRMWKKIGDCTTKISDHERRAEGDSAKEREAHFCCVNSCSPVRLKDGGIGLLSSGRDSVVRVWKLPMGPGGLTAPRLMETIECNEGDQRLILLNSVATSL